MPAAAASPATARTRAEASSASDLNSWSLDPVRASSKTASDRRKATDLMSAAVKSLVEPASARYAVQTASALPERGVRLLSNSTSRRPVTAKERSGSARTARHRTPRIRVRRATPPSKPTIRGICPRQAAGRRPEVRHLFLPGGVLCAPESRPSRLRARCAERCKALAERGTRPRPCIPFGGGCLVCCRHAWSSSIPGPPFAAPCVGVTQAQMPSCASDRADLRRMGLMDRWIGCRHNGS
ncbi:hypothetical protein DFJ74DRAFT_501447 [Hyaloraphidium curvatum]|nr:hypothetical protein DFJ74DRAFT_501447 [Hyaloraphidium curvatum]